ncbi:MAG: phosphatidylglycerophosphatase A [Gammaproteobacteria bacterium]|nr:phosphatidylglycerophosphatase A [Gammaproteobacteria bacterium]
MSRATGTSVRDALSLTDPGHLLALGLGTGLLPRAPGTWGSLLAIPVFFMLHPFGPVIYVAAVTVLFVLGIYLCGRTARALGVHDHGAIVIDEVVGMLVTWVAAGPGWFTVVAGFVLFRFFDIVKPWPIRRIDREVAGGMGIMLDDLLAGLMAAAVLQALLQVAPAALAVIGA